MSILIISIILNFSFIRYKNFKDLQDINTAKTVLNEIFFNLSISSLKLHKKQSMKLDFLNKKIIIDNYSTKKQELKLPQSLSYYHTYPTYASSFLIEFTQNGNISKSFSIYIFDRKNKLDIRFHFMALIEVNF